MAHVYAATMQTSIPKRARVASVIFGGGALALPFGGGFGGALGIGRVVAFGIGGDFDIVGRTSANSEFVLAHADDG